MVKETGKKARADTKDPRMHDLKRDWKDWTREDWNEKLFLHFFYDSDGEDRPVRSIPVTLDELAKVVSDSGADTHEIQEAFLGVVRTSSHIEFNHRLSRYHIDQKTGWKGEEIPPFFVELAFSCLVASPPDGEIRNDGDFRNRLALLLGHEQTAANYPLERLASFWRAFSKWLDERRTVGDPYRRLELPPLDHRVRIGYSINLAFPSRKDLINLIDVLSKGEFEEDPPIPSVFDLVGNSIEKFSTNFRRAYDEFRQAFRSKERNLERFPFWGAVRDAVASNLEDEKTKDLTKRSLKLVLEQGGVVLLLSTIPGDVIGKLMFKEADSPYGEFKGFLCVNSDSDFDFLQATYQATQRLLQERYQNVLTGKGWRSIEIAIEQGLLLFMKSESLTWELTFARQEEGSLQALVKDSLVTCFLDAFPKDMRPYRKPSRYQGWTELEQFPGKRLDLLAYPENSPLAAIRCLQPTFSGPRLSLVGGCPVDGGYLGIPVCLPLVRAPQADEVRIDPIDREKSGNVIQLTRVQMDSNDFTFPKALQNPLDGCYRVISSLKGRVLVNKRIVFRPDIVVNSYARPTEPHAWEIEAGGPDVLTYGEEANGDHRPSEYKNQATHNTGDNAVTISRVSGRLHMMKSSLPTWQRFDTLRSRKEHDVWEPCDFTESVRLMEVCGGLAMRRKGITEAELMDLVRECLTVERYNKQWDVVRAWTEGGYLDRLQYKKWRRTEYFPRPPRFVLEKQKGFVRGVLFGLATPAIRNRSDIELLESGAKRIQVLSRSKWVVPSPAWRAPSADPYIRLSKILGFEEPVWMKPLVETLWSLNEIVASREAPPRFYECWGCWEWDKGWFSQDIKPRKEGIEVVRFHRPDRSPYYLVTIDGENVWWSTSRNWSLLLAHELKGEAIFALAGTDQVVRIGKGQVHLPLPIGRHLAMTGITVPGPIEDANGGYIYQFKDSKERLLFLSAIWGGVELDTAEMRRWARWILSLSNRPTMVTSVRAVPLPNPIRQGLKRFYEVPEVRELSRTKIDPSILPRVREGLSRFTKARGV